MLNTPTAARLRLFAAGVALALIAPAALAIDAAHDAKARTLIDKSIAYLRTQQDAATGGWGVKPDKDPQLPAITALVINAMLLDPRLNDADPAIKRGAEFILKYRQPNGAIYDRILPSYNTSIALSALARVHSPEAEAAIKSAQDYLRGSQWSEQTVPTPDSPADSAVGPTVDKSNPFYGGLGYGRSGRPDLSNLSMMLQGMHDSGVDCNDPAFQRALVFLARTQMHEKVNDMPYAKGSRQGGFIYATSPNKDRIGEGQSELGSFEETMDDGTKVSRLRAYGSMTYSGFKSYLYAQLDRNDPRVQLAYDWIRQNYSVTENPGAGADGLFYYYLTFARAMKAWGEPTINTIPSSAPGASRMVEPHDWANDLIDRLAELQNPDGSFVNTASKRWMESDPVLVTAYALLALGNAVN